MAQRLVLLIDRFKHIFDALAAKVPRSEWILEMASDDPTVLSQQLSRMTVLIGGLGDTNQLLRGAGKHFQLLQVPFTGTDWLDKTAVAPGAYVCNVHDQDVGIAEYVLCQMLQWGCRVHEVDALMRQSCKAAAEKGEDAGFSAPWMQEPRPAPRPELLGRTLGIVGYGSIGKAVAVRAAAFGMRVVATVGRPQPPPLEAPLDWIGSGAADLDRLLRESDFVLLACPLSDATKGLIGAGQLGSMQQHAVLINVGRGGVVDEVALFSALQEKRIGGAILDVWWKYPDAAKRQRTCAPASAECPFHTLPNVVMSPHASGWSEGKLGRGQLQIADNLARLAAGEPLCNVVYKRSPDSSL